MSQQPFVNVLRLTGVADDTWIRATRQGNVSRTMVRGVIRWTADEIDLSFCPFFPF